MTKLSGAKPEVWKKILLKGAGEVIHLYGFIKEIAREFYNKYGEEEMQDIAAAYLYYDLTCYDLDTIYMQLVLLFGSPEEISKFYLSFSSDVKFKMLFKMEPMALGKFVRDEDNEKLVKLLPDYLRMFNIIITNDISMANTLVKLADRFDIENYKETSITQDWMVPYENFIKNTFFALGSSNASRIRKIFLNFFGTGFPILKLARGILDYDRGTNIFRLKKEDQDGRPQSFTLTPFYKNDNVLSEIVEGLFEKGMHKDFFACELVQPHFPYLKNLAPRIINDTVMDLVLLIGGIGHVDQVIGAVIKPILDFSNILFSYICKITKSEDTDGLNQCIKENLSYILFFLDNHFANFAEEFHCEENSMREGLLSFKSQIGKIKSSNLYFYLNPNERPQPTEPSPISDEKKPVSVQNTQDKNSKKRDRLKNKLKGKGKDFLQKFELLHEDSGLKNDGVPLDGDGTGSDGENYVGANLKPKYGGDQRPEADLCIHCLMEICPKENRVIPVFIHLIGYNENDRNIQVSSCRHSVHSDCFKKVERKFKVYWLDQYLCPQCKFISNSRIIVDAQQTPVLKSLRDSFVGHESKLLQCSDIIPTFLSKKG